jgi:hypothetical protein
MNQPTKKEEQPFNVTPRPGKKTKTQPTKKVSK